MVKDIIFNLCYMETEAGTRKRKRKEAQKRILKKY